MNVMFSESFKTARTAEIATKKMMNSLMMPTFLRSFMPLLAGAITSSVNVELEVSTSDDSVDIEAASTSTITIAMITSGSSESIAGTMLSKNGLVLSASCHLMAEESAKRRPKPPRK